MFTMLVGGVVVYFGTGCGGRSTNESASSTHWVNLVEAFPLADVSMPTQRIDFRRDVAQRNLIRGWSMARQSDKGPSGRWSLGDGAEIEFFVATPRDLEVTLRAVARGQPPPEGLTVGLLVNGVKWTDLSLEGVVKSFSRPLPASMLQPGHNRLEIEHPGERGEEPIKKAKDFRVLWKSITFGENSGEQVVEPKTSPENSLLFLPVGARVDFFLASAAAKTLTFERVTQRRMPAGRLQLSWTGIEGESQVIVEDLLDWPDNTVDLSQLRGSEGRLSFFVLPEDDGGLAAEAGVLLFSPRLGIEVGPATRNVAQKTIIDRRPGELPNIILYVIDTLRADHLGCYGFGRPVSPHIDRFAEGAAVFLNAQAQSPWTRASVASIFTGLLPHQHTANDDHDALPDQAITMAELLNAAGYTTAAVSSNSNASEVFGFAQGFDSFERLKRQGANGQPPRSSEVNAAAFRWIEDHSDSEPFFLFLHTIDPHAPYRPPDPFRSQFAAGVADLQVGSVENIQELARSRKEIPSTTVQEILDLYAAEVAANDQSFGDLVAYLEDRSLLDGTLIVLVSDHGEEFNEHGQWAHGKSLFTEVIDVPLIIRLPHSDEGLRVDEIVQQVDILPTLLDYLGLELPAGVAGRSLLPLIEAGGDLEWPERAVSQMRLRGRTATSYIGADWKVIVPQFAGQEGFPMLYDRRADRQELEDLAGGNEELARYWASQLRGAVAAAQVGADSQSVSEEERAELEGDLRALGYIQ